ncbi:MAG: hypothetical protein HY762_06685 [Planctomycetes bacterium]|nr:hypothetical protein [Planctomycetota bacterium]
MRSVSGVPITIGKKNEIEPECRQCGRRIPRRNKQVNFACQSEGLCRRCYEAPFRAGEGLGRSLARVVDIDEDEPFDCGNTSPWEWHGKAIRSTE